MLKIEDIILYERNAKIHTQEQLSLVARSIKELGFDQPIVIDEHGVIIVGHGRFLAARDILGWTDVREGVAVARKGEEFIPVLRRDDLSEEEVKARRLNDNRLNEMTDIDMKLILPELQYLETAGFDIDLTGYSTDLLSEQEHEEHAKLVDTFVVPPFSVLDTRQGYWQDRKRMWVEKTGNLTDTKEHVLSGGKDSLLATINGGSSNFDPVLAEVMYRWFNVEGGKILDPFAGEQTKGVVAGELGMGYVGVEIRNEQVDVNKAATKNYDGVKYVCGDSNDIGKLVKESDFDMVFTSPPYYDLEVYSKEDMSSLGTYNEFMRQYENIFAECIGKLKDGRFVVVKVAEIRDKKSGAYRNFVADNIAIMERAGATYYNEIILVNAIGTLPVRAAKVMNASRKVGKCHQNVLVFYKGDVKKIGDNFPPVVAEQAAEF
jgi:DNA modification methylase